MNAPLSQRDAKPSVQTAARRFPFKTLLFFLVPTALLAAFFFRPIADSERFAYRDVGYFYYPLFEQIQREWERGRLPLWDPFENLGQPLAGNPTSSVFYPGKAIFFLASAGCVDFNACFSFYIVGHVALAFFGVFLLTRRLGVSRAGSVLAGTSYAFSGPILFQYSNVVFLVGAAWLPFLALFSFEFFASPTVGGKLKSTLKLSVAQALAILGGEPQIVYLSTLAFLAFAVVAPVRLIVKTAPSSLPNAPVDAVSKLARLDARPAKRAVVRVRDCFRARVALGLFLCVGASTATFFLAAPQILPSAELIARSGRAASGPPRSLWEIPAALWRNSAPDDGDASSPATRSPRQNQPIAQNKKSGEDKEKTQNAQIAQDSQTAQNKETDFYSSLLCRDVANNGRSRATYRFSVGPWRWAERLFPNVGGRQFPRSSRWFAIFPEEIAVWTPTLYCGVVPYLLALAAANFGFGGRRSRKNRRQNRAFRSPTLAALPQRSPRNALPNARATVPRNDLENACSRVAPAPFYRRDRATTAAFRVWATWLVLLSTTAALGGFGIVWAVRFCGALLSGAQPASSFVDGDPVGGLYWLFNLTLPKFVEFRYPAKLLTLSALGLAVLTAFGWDERRFSRRFFAIAVSVGAVSVGALAVLSALGDDIFSTLRAVDPLHGPVQPRLAFASVRGAFAQTALVLAATLVLFAVERRIFKTKFGVQNKKKAFSFVAFAVLAVSALDLYVGNAWTIATVPPSFFEKRSEISRIVEAERAARVSARLADVSPTAPPSSLAASSARLDETNAATFRLDETNAASSARLDAPPLRVYRFPVWFPNAFPIRSSDARILERVVWDAATLFPKLPFSRQIATIDARGTATDAEYSAFIDAFPLGLNRDADAAFLDVAFFLGPPEVTSRLAAPTDAPSSEKTRKTDKVNKTDKVAEISAAKESNGIDETAPRTPPSEFAAANVALRRVQAPSNRVWIFRDDRPAPLPNERAEVVVYEPNQIVYFVALDQPADLVFAEQYWPDWEGRAYPLDADAAAALLRVRFDADAASEFLKMRRGVPFETPIKPTLRFLRQTSLPAGTYCFVATYRPRRLFVGALLGAFAWLGIGGAAVALVVCRRRRRRRKRVPDAPTDDATDAFD